MTLTEIEGRLAAAAAAPSAINLESRRMEKEARQRLRHLRGLLERNPDEARRALEALLDGPLRFQPAETPEGRRYEISGKVAVGSLFTTESVPRGNAPAVHVVVSGDFTGAAIALDLVA